MIEDSEKYKAWVSRRKVHLDNLRSEVLFSKILQNDRAALANAITLIESSKPEHRLEANALITQCLPYSGKAWRIGITGVPGVGKSTFIEAIGEMLVQRGQRLAVMAIDPSSSVSGGSILGDKTRMEKLASMEEVFIRPTASGNTLGGVAQHTRETIILCEAAGYDVIFIETVGVGQNETLVHSMVDFFLLLMLSGAGDELQGIKRGIMEMADGILITKSDQGNEASANQAKRTYENALHLLQSKESGWDPKVAPISSLTKKDLHFPIQWWEDYYTGAKASGYLESKRKEQDLRFFEEGFQYQMAAYIAQNQKIRSKHDELKQKISSGTCSPYEASNELFNMIVNDGNI